MVDHVQIGLVMSVCTNEKSDKNDDCRLCAIPVCTHTIHILSPTNINTLLAV